MFSECLRNVSPGEPELNRSPRHSHPVLTHATCPGWGVVPIFNPYEKVSCVVCGREISYERSRLFFGDGGTFRTCMRGNTFHAWTGKKYV